MSSNHTQPPHDAFSPPGTVSVSPAALAMAREFDRRIRAARSDRNWVVAFDWADSRSMRPRLDGPRQEIGAGLDLVAFDLSDVPHGAIQRTEGLAFAVRIPSRIWEASTYRLIDTDKTAFSGLTLR